MRYVKSILLILLGLCDNTLCFQRSVLTEPSTSTRSPQRVTAIGKLTTSSLISGMTTMTASEDQARFAICLQLNNIINKLLGRYKTHGALIMAVR